jgi:cytochrome P450
MPNQNDDALSLANLLMPEVRADPWPFYRRLRETDPVHWDEPLSFWSVSRYADVAAVFHDERFVKGQGLSAMLAHLSPEARQRAEPVYEVFGRQVLYSDPPQHTRLRGQMKKAFTPKVVERMRGHIQEIVDGLLDEAEARGRMDGIGDLAYPLTFTVILETIGLPLSQRDEFKQWSNDFMASLGLVRRLPEVFERAHESLAEITFDLYNLHDERHREPCGDLLSEMAALEAEGDKLDHGELVANVILLLAAGHETTTNLIGNGLLALLRHPEQMQVLRDEPALMKDAVEELLRFDNPTHIVWRYAAEDAEVGGRKIARGQFVNLMTGGANRDPEAFPDSDRLDVRRGVTRHVGFGMGPHFCIGAPLATLEGAIALGTVIRRFPNIRLETEALEWTDNPTFHGLKSLPLLLD